MAMTVVMADVAMTMVRMGDDDGDGDGDDTGADGTYCNGDDVGDDDCDGSGEYSCGDGCDSDCDDCGGVCGYDGVFDVQRTRPVEPAAGRLNGWMDALTDGWTRRRADDMMDQCMG